MKINYYSIITGIASISSLFAQNNQVIQQTYVGVSSSAYCAVQKVYNQIYSSGKPYTISNIDIQPVGNNSYIAVYTVKQPIKK